MAVPQTASILLVDDQLISMAVTEAALLRLGFRNIDKAQSAEEALETYRNSRHDVIFSDWHMSPTNGPELLRHVMSASGIRRPKFFFLTGDTGWAPMVTARELGADGHLLKSIRPQDLVKKLSDALLLQ